MEAIIKVINGYAWGWPMLLLIAGTGIFLSVGLTFLPLRKLGYGFKQLWSGRHSQGEGDISAFNALMTSLSATVGTGNIAGVATALFLGGPGALFWMWAIALIGMATKYAEAVLAVKYRETDYDGLHIGGPMYYIKNGMSKSWTWLAFAFAFFGAIAGFGIGNTVQANSVADALQSTFSIPPEYTGITLAILVALVLIGGIQRLAKVAGKLVPFMAIAYILGGVIVLAIKIDQIPAAFSLIFTHAFSPVAATGGFAGATLMAAMRYGIARGVFSNEAGLGSAPIAHAAARTDNPIRQGTIAMLGTFIDTIILCSITGLVIITTEAWTSGETGASLSSLAFSQALPNVGSYNIGSLIVSFGLAIFAFTTLLGWSFYGEKCVQFLFGDKSVIPFRILWIIAIPVGAISQLDMVWLIADTLNALMALPNLIALIVLSPVVFKLSRDYFANKGQQEAPVSTPPRENHK